MMKPKIEVFNSTGELSGFLGNIIVKLSVQLDFVNISLSGGNTPRAIFDILSTEYTYLVNWDKIRLFWVDERCVEPGHHESNYGMTLNHLIKNLPIPGKNIFRIEAEQDPQLAANSYSETLKNNLPFKNDLPYFDLMILGMGDDGHTASIFPDNMHLWDSHNLCEVATHPVSRQKRITLTGRTINNSRMIVFIVTGSNKSLVFNEIITHSGNYSHYPASLVDKSKTTWLVDKAAACKTGIS